MQNWNFCFSINFLNKICKNIKSKVEREENLLQKSKKDKTTFLHLNVNQYLLLCWLFLLLFAWNFPFSCSEMMEIFWNGLWSIQCTYSQLNLGNLKSFYNLNLDLIQKHFQRHGCKFPRVWKTFVVFFIILLVWKVKDFWWFNFLLQFHFKSTLLSKLFPKSHFALFFEFLWIILHIKSN